MKLRHDFSFPLNVYGAMLQSGEGRADGLRDGLFEHEGEAQRQARERASARLWAQMPPPCRVLEVGIGLGRTLRHLRESGYDAVGITPEVAQAAAARALQDEGLSIVSTSLEAFAPAGPRFDLMVLQESAQFIEPLALFEAADRLLSQEQASLLVMDVFALQRSLDGEFGLHLLPHFKSLATRFGWKLGYEEDVSDQARHTVSELQRLTRRHAIWLGWSRPMPVLPTVAAAACLAIACCASSAWPSPRTGPWRWTPTVPLTCAACSSRSSAGR